MNELHQNLYITYSNPKVRDLTLEGVSEPLDKVVTLENLIYELYEKNNFSVVIDNILGSSILYHIITSEKIEYFSYLLEGADGLEVIYDFLIKCARNKVAFKSLLNGEKLEAIVQINKAYQEYKQLHALVDLSDIEHTVLENWDRYFEEKYKEIYIDSFELNGISFLKSKNQEAILNKFSRCKQLKKDKQFSHVTKIIKPSHEVFDNIDEVKTALKIVRKLLQSGVKSDEILIITSEIQEYAPLYKLFLNEYELKGYSSLGTSLNSFHHSQSQEVKVALNNYKTQVSSLEEISRKLGLSFSEIQKEKLKASIKISDEKIGVEITEANQIMGLNRSYKHIIFIGTDINHFPPKVANNFLYSYEDELNYFYVNNYFKDAQAQLNELKHLSKNLYIITASYSGKRELSPSILIDDDVDELIDVSEVKSVNQLALEGQTKQPEIHTHDFYKSIVSDICTVYDGHGIEGVDASHLSASQINKYTSCPLAYFYSNKIRLKAPTQDEEGFDVMQQGSLMHLCYELFGRYIKENQLKTKNRDELYGLMYEVSVEAYNAEETVENRADENIHHQVFLTTLQAGLKDERKVGLLAKFVDYYIEKAEELEFFQNTEFEMEFALDAELKPYKLRNQDDKSYFIKGFIDRFDNLSEQINIIDYKSKKMNAKVDKEKMEQIKELQDVQLALYILFASQEYQDKSYFSSLLSFKSEKPYVHFANLSNQKEKDTELYDKIYEHRLKELIFKTKENIGNGNFSFNNSNEKMCEYCDIKHICHESVLNKNNQGI